MAPENEQAICHICRRSFPVSDLTPARDLKPDILALITADHPQFTNDSHICFEDHHQYRLQRLRNGLDLERKHLEKLEQFLRTSVAQYDNNVKNLKTEHDEPPTFGERMADGIADIGGSWRFIFGFIGFLGAWIILNTFAFITKPPDPYPYILLNLVLSCLAALQAPIIMMSQNRQEEKDRKRSQHDWEVDMKAEMEIRHLNARVDFLVSHRWERLIEIQEIQLDMMEYMRTHRPQGRGNSTGASRLTDRE